MASCPTTPNPCDHCWHNQAQPHHMVLEDGHVLQRCCQCGDTRQVHVDYTWEVQSRG